MKPEYCKVSVVCTGFLNKDTLLYTSVVQLASCNRPGNKLEFSSCRSNQGRISSKTKNKPGQASKKETKTFNDRSNKHRDTPMNYQ